MVRSIDKTLRRQELAEAVWRIILREGLDAASVRNVAREAKLSAGSVRHFFSSQAELHVFAMEALSDRVASRIAQAATTDDPRTRIMTMLAELLPVTDRSESEFRIWMQFVLRAQFDVRLELVAKATIDAVRELLLRVVASQRELGLISQHTDIEDSAIELNALIDGLMFERLAAPHMISREQTLAVLARWLDSRYLGGPHATEKHDRTVRSV